MTDSLKDIIELCYNIGLPSENPSKVALRLDGHIKDFLTKNYVNLFSNPQHKFDVPGLINANQKSTQTLILQALGIPSHSTPMTFNSALFNPKKLDQLFKKDRNPMWLVVKSTIPFSDQWPAKDKIQTYVDIASLYANKKIKEALPHEIVLMLARAVFALARSYPDVTHIILAKIAFSPVSTQKIPKQLCKEGQFGNWLVEQHTSSQEDDAISNDLQSELFASDITPSPAKISLLERNPFRPKATDETLSIFKSEIDRKLAVLSGNEKQIAYILKELITANEDAFMRDMSILHQFLDVFETIDWLTDEEKKQYANFAEDVKALLVAYRKLNLTENITADQSLASMVTAISNRFTTDAFDQFSKCVEKFIYSSPQLDKIEQKYHEKMVTVVLTKRAELKAEAQFGGSLSFITLKPVQSILKLPLLFRDLQKNLPTLPLKVVNCKAGSDLELETAIKAASVVKEKVTKVAEGFNEKKKALDEDLARSPLSKYVAEIGTQVKKTLESLRQGTHTRDKPVVQKRSFRVSGTVSLDEFQDTVAPLPDEVSASSDQYLISTATFSTGHKAVLCQDHHNVVIDVTTDPGLTPYEKGKKALKQAAIFLNKHQRKDGPIVIKGFADKASDAKMLLAAVLKLKKAMPDLKEVEIMSLVPGCVVPAPDRFLGKKETTAFIKSNLLIPMILEENEIDFVLLEGEPSNESQDKSFTDGSKSKQALKESTSGFFSVGKGVSQDASQLLTSSICV